MNKITKFIKKYWITFCIFLGLVLLYVVATEKEWVNPYLFPSVDEIKEAFASSHGMMLGNMIASFKLLIPSIVVSLIIALLLGTIMGMNKRVREVLHPVIYAFSVIPSILLSPFVLLLAPTLFSASVFLIVYNIVWATLFATITGIMTIDKHYLDKAATLELTGFKRMIKVILPAASPSIMSGFVNSLRSSFVMLVFAEMYGAGEGMGYFVKKYAELGIFANTWVGFVFMVIVLVIVMQIFEVLKKHMLKWTIDEK
nr:ABC transporter permease subunit [uncultured Sellimonas sp.]